MDTMTKIKVGLFDLDGSLTPQGGVMDVRVAAVLRGLKGLGLRLGLASGKNADYIRGIAVGIGASWDFISAEGGAQFLRLLQENPPIWEHEPLLNVNPNHLILFGILVQLNFLNRTFLYRNEEVDYRPESKERIITVFPRGVDPSISVGWADYFREVIHTHQLRLIVKRHRDGGIDVIPEGITKRLGLTQVCQLYGCGEDEVLTVVEGENDDDLIGGTRSIAVSNAVPRIKDLVQKEGGFIASLPDGLGFAEGLLYYARMGLLPEGVESLVLQHIPEADTPQSHPS